VAVRWGNPILAAIAVFVSGLGLSTAVGQQQDTPAPAISTASTAGDTPGAATPLGSEMADTYRRIEEGLARVVAAHEAGRRSLQENLDSVREGLKNFDTAEAYVNARLNELHGLLDDLKPDGDFVKAIGDVQARARKLTEELRVSSETRAMAAEAEVQEKLASDAQERTKQIRQQLYDQIAKIESQKTIIVASRKLQNIKIMNQAISSALSSADAALAATKDFAEKVRPLSINTQTQ
jgi:hypothetical protein